MKLIELIKGIDNLEISGERDILIEGVSSFSKRVKKNYLFAALPGFKTDGFFYLEEAIKNGANSFLLPKERKKAFDEKKGFTYLYTEEIRKIYSLICKNFYGQVDDSLILIGITGTQGKTTTTYLVKHILNSFNISTGLIGTINHFDGENWIKSLNTTPESEFIYSSLNKLYTKNIKYCIMEVSSHALALDRVYGLNFQITGLTNLGHDHLDFHKDIENYKRSKKRLFEYLKKDGWAIINIDDEFGKELFEELNKKGINIITYGIDSFAQIEGEILKMDLEGMEFIVKINNKRLKGRVKIFGKFNLYNILLSFGVAQVLGFDSEDILEKIEDFKGVSGRLERVENDFGIKAFVDFAHTPESLEEVLKALRPFSKKLILIFGCGGERDKEKRPLMGKVACKYADTIIITQDNSRSEDFKDILKDILKGIDKEVIVEEDRKKAIEKGVSLAKAEDTILVAGKGHEDYQIIGDQIFYFSDKEELKKAFEKCCI